jgi:hypothetical protein
MSFATTGRLPGLPEPTEAQQRKIQILCGTIAGILREANCNDLEAKAVVSNLAQEFGTLEQYSEDQQKALKYNYRQKRRPPKAPAWRAR